LILDHETPDFSAKSSWPHPNRYRDDEGVKAQAWDRGANVAMQYQRAMHHMATTPIEADEAEPGWLVGLLRTGRR
jgi:hypothetical protein